MTVIVLVLIFLFIYLIEISKIWKACDNYVSYAGQKFSKFWSTNQKVI